MEPQVLFKAFDDREHAEDFALRGRLRFSSLRFYQAAADPARRDGSEGKAGDRAGASLAGGIDLDRCLVCSFTASAAASPRAVPDKFGRYLVRIDDPARLLADVSAALARDAVLAPHRVELEHGFVRYDLGNAGPPQSDAEARRRAWLHKAGRHRHEAEFRLMFESPRRPPDAPHHHIDLGEPPRYARLLVKPPRRTASKETDMSGREIFYAALAVFGLVVPWFFNLQFMAQHPGSFDLLAFFGEGFTTAATASMTMDLFIAFTAFAIFVVVEARRVGMRHGWAYVVLGFFVAFACAFPLFLCLRERHLRRAA